MNQVKKRIILLCIDAIINNICVKRNGIPYYDNIRYWLICGKNSLVCDHCTYLTYLQNTVDTLIKY